MLEQNKSKIKKGELDFSSRNLKDYDGMFNDRIYSNIRVLNLSHNLFTSLKCFNYMPRLYKLDLSHNKIESIKVRNQEDFMHKGLTGLLFLEELNLSHNLIYDLNGFQLVELKHLKKLKINDNRINKLD